MIRLGWLLVLATCLSVPAPAWSGANCGASAVLTWSSDTIQTTLDSSAQYPHPLYVLVKGAADVQQLAISLSWFPADSAARCFTVIPSEAADQCAGVTLAQAPQSFRGDSSFMWQIIPVSGADSVRCVRFLVAYGGCTPKPDVQFLASVWTVDSNGLLDSLQLELAAALGSTHAQAFAVDELHLPTMLPNQSLRLPISGSGFVPGTGVQLVASPALISQDHDVVVESPDLLLASLRLPSAEGSYDLQVTRPDGQTITLRGLVRTADTQPPPSIPSLRRPTNNDAAFLHPRVIDDLTDVSSAIETSLEEAYPSILQSPHLLVTRSASDTMAMFASTPFRLLAFVTPSPTPSSYAVYQLDTPIYASSIGFLLNCGWAFSAPPAFSSYGQPLVTATVTYEDGSTFSHDLTIGHDIRGFVTSSMGLDCGGIQLYELTQPPDNPLDAVVYSGTYKDDAYANMDAQEVPLPPTSWRKRIAALRLDAHYVAASCPYGYNYWAGGYLSGIDLWPNMNIADVSATSVTRQTQGTGHSYGGYLWNGIAVGTRRRMNDNGCLISCLAMDFTYHGIPTTADGLNSYVREHRGYIRDFLGNVTNVAGDSVTVDGTPADFSIDTHHSNKINYKDFAPASATHVADTFVIERGPYNPIATVAIIYKKAMAVGGTKKRAVTYVATHHQPTIAIAVGDSCFTYRYAYMGIFKAYSLNQYEVLQTSPSAGAAPIEDQLMRGEPTILCTHSKHVGFHFVLADGWRPAYTPQDSAQGTYTLKDPGFSKQRLIEAPFKNEFLYGRYLHALGGGGAPSRMTRETMVGSGHRLVLHCDGVSNVCVQDPMGRHIRYQPYVGEYATDIGDVIAVHGWEDADDDGYDDVASEDDVIDIGVASDGQYLIQVARDEEGPVSLSAGTCDADQQIGSAGITDDDVNVDGRVYSLTCSGGVLAFARLASSSVSAGAPLVPRVVVCGNPGRTMVVFEMSGFRGPQIVDIYDLMGRRVGEVRTEATSERAQRVKWRPSEGGARSGVYFARVRGWREGRSIRFVIL